MAVKKARDLEHMDRIIDPDGNVAVVMRLRWVDHLRGQLETDLGRARVLLDEEFELAP